MSKLSGNIRINASKALVWEILSDLGAVQDFNPTVAKSYYNPGKREGVGASRHCDLKPMGSIEETIIEWKEGESFKLRIHDTKKAPPFKTAIGQLSVHESGGATVASMEIDYTLKFGPVGAMMDTMMVKPQFRKAIKRTLQGLKQFAEDKSLAAA